MSRRLPSWGAQPSELLRKSANKQAWIKQYIHQNLISKQQKEQTTPHARNHQWKKLVTKSPQATPLTSTDNPIGAVEFHLPDTHTRPFIRLSKPPHNPPENALCFVQRWLVKCSSVCKYQLREKTKTKRCVHGLF